MRPEGVRKAMREAEGRHCVIQLNSGKRIPVKGRENWMIDDEYLYVLANGHLNWIAFRNITSIEMRMSRKSRARSG